jgi:hypothetical protein
LVPAPGCRTGCAGFALEGLRDGIVPLAGTATILRAAPPATKPLMLDAKPGVDRELAPVAVSGYAGVAATRCAAW